MSEKYFRVLVIAVLIGLIVAQAMTFAGISTLSHHTHVPEPEPEPSLKINSLRDAQSQVDRYAGAVRVQNEIMRALLERNIELESWALGQ